MAASWADVLDLYDRALDNYQRQLDEGDTPKARFDFELPPDLGPVPPELAEQARVVQEKSARVEERVRDAMTQTAREQTAVTRARAQATMARKRPAFVDVELDTYQVDVAKVEAMIGPDTRALLVPNLIGGIPDWDALRAIADRRGLILIEDSCDTLGARLRGTPAYEVADFIHQAGQFTPLEFTVGRFVLFSSRASVGGGPYLVEQSYPLAA